ncbi:hypothetical protein AVEN_172671-1 [Araneus ventricosus]|uniref:Uncharacterized protein n=1 Tax=Araneus ventricosus TaxID=182803 RepID=A0A4Y2EHG7_ARAVE|nr:hypothetical protein AVEN_262542-1 [Araneus ventricosus]GBM28251.1 hypothetical protein AVEN_149603-1 [Araneus ventricosus]GBM28263.1 hypothetical protein AVEN_160469-1 [Araneus ventricosus]GBM28281.1 hypothetical protein AVEN_172671-1 [Araneus ventricosus]
MDLVILNRSQMMRTTPELAPPSPSFHTTPTGGRLATTYDLACNRSHTRRFFNGCWDRIWDPQAPKPRPYQQATAARQRNRISKVFFRTAETLRFIKLLW